MWLICSRFKTISSFQQHAAMLVRRTKTCLMCTCMDWLPPVALKAWIKQTMTREERMRLTHWMLHLLLSRRRDIDSYEVRRTPTKCLGFQIAFSQKRVWQSWSWYLQNVTPLSTACRWQSFLTVTNLLSLRSQRQRGSTSSYSQRCHWTMVQSLVLVLADSLWRKAFPAITWWP